jgi:hypothetical protein
MQEVGSVFTDPQILSVWRTYGDMERSHRLLPRVLHQFNLIFPFTDPVFICKCFGFRFRTSMLYSSKCPFCQNPLALLLRLCHLQARSCATRASLLLSKTVPLLAVFSEKSKSPSKLCPLPRYSLPIVLNALINFRGRVETLQLGELEKVFTIIRR